MEPHFNDYVELIYNRFEAFTQASASANPAGHPLVYPHKSMIVFFMWMQFKRIYSFKTQWKWLQQPPEALAVLGWEKVPHRTSLSRRYKQWYALLDELVVYLGQASRDLGDELKSAHLYEDQSLFKAHGPVWHQSDRQQGRIPDHLRHLDTDATWAKSRSHGWVYGYGLHLTANAYGFPVLMQVETAAYDETAALQTKQERLLTLIQPQTVCGDDAYTQVVRIRRWARQGVILLTPALRWRNGRYARAYHRFIQQSEMALLTARKTAIEPIFDLIGKILGVTSRQKQLTLQRLPNVRTAIGLAVLSLQLVMIANSVWSLPFRAISTLKGAFA
jgi:hypothetical protein